MVTEQKKKKVKMSVLTDQRSLIVGQGVTLPGFEHGDESALIPIEKNEPDLDNNTTNNRTKNPQKKKSSNVGFHGRWSSSAAAVHNTVLFALVAIVVCFSSYSWYLHQQTASELENVKVQIKRLADSCHSRGQQMEGPVRIKTDSASSFRNGHVERRVPSEFAASMQKAVS